MEAFMGDGYLRLEDCEGSHFREQIFHARILFRWRWGDSCESPCPQAYSPRLIACLLMEDPRGCHATPRDLPHPGVGEARSKFANLASQNLLTWFTITNNKIQLSPQSCSKIIEDPRHFFGFDTFDTLKVFFLLNFWVLKIIFSLYISKVK